MDDFTEFNEYKDGPNFNQPDDAFMPFFEKKKVSLKNVSTVWKLKHTWFVEKLKTFDEIGCPWEIRQFFWSLPHDYQIESPKVFIDSIAILKRRFLYSYLLEKKLDEQIYLHSGRDTDFCDLSSSHKNALRDEIYDVIKSIKLKTVIDASHANEDEYFENTFLYACFNFFLQNLFWEEYRDDCWWSNEYLITKKNKNDAQDFFFEEFLKDIPKSTTQKFLKYFNDVPIYYHRDLGFKDFLKYRDERSSDAIRHHGDEICKFYDLHSLYQAKNKVAINNMVGASKLIARFSDLMTDETINFLRYEKEFKGEMTIINLKKEVINNKESFCKKSYLSS